MSILILGVNETPQPKKPMSPRSVVTSMDIQLPIELHLLDTPITCINLSSNLYRMRSQVRKAMSEHNPDICLVVAENKQSNMIYLDQVVTPPQGKRKQKGALTTYISTLGRLNELECRLGLAGMSVKLRRKNPSSMANTACFEALQSNLYQYGNCLTGLVAFPELPRPVSEQTGAMVAYLRRAMTLLILEVLAQSGYQYDYDDFFATALS